MVPWSPHSFVVISLMAVMENSESSLSVKGATLHHLYYHVRVSSHVWRQLVFCWLVVEVDW